MPQVIATRRSVAAIVLKPEEGSLTKPTAASQFISIQPDFTLSPNFETVENVEIKDDIMSSKTIITGEAPTATYSHYFKGSGTSGKAPQFGPLIQASFGSTRKLSTEATLTAGSTTNVLKMSSSDAAKFKKGDAVFVDNTNKEKEVRAVQSVSGTDVTLAFHLSSAPATATKIGKFVTYYPSSDAIPVFDLWHYIGGGDSGVENIQDCRTTSMTISATAKDLINSTFNFEGTGYRFNEDFTPGWKVETGKNQFNVVTSSASNTATIAAGTYATGAAMAAELQKAHRAAGGSGQAAANVTYANGKFVAKSNENFYWRFLDNSQDLEQALGFDRKTRTPAGTLTSDNNAPVPRDYSNQTVMDSDITYDQTDPIVARDQQIFIGNPAEKGDSICIETSSATFTFGTPRTLITSVCTESGNYRSIINQRTATLAVSAILQEDDRRFFSKFKNGDTTYFAFTGGKKESGVWQKGQVFTVLGSPASITSFAITNSDNVFALDLELTCFAEGGGEGSVFISFA